MGNTLDEIMQQVDDELLENQENLDEQDENLDDELDIEIEEPENFEDDEDGEYLDDNEEDEDEQDNNQQVSNPNQQKSKYTKEEKEAYAWGKLNDEIATYKHQNQKLNDLLDRMAQANGVANRDDFINLLEGKLMEVEAKQKNVPVEHLKTVRKLEQDVQSLQTLNQKVAYDNALRSVGNVVNGLIDEYKLDENAVHAMFQNLEDSGYTLDTLIKLPNPKVVLRGALSDIIYQKSAKKTVKRQQKLENMAETQGIQTLKTKQSYSIDEDVADFLNEYKKNNGLD